MSEQDNITQEYLKSILDYVPETGIFIWKVNKGTRARIGKIAGSKKKDKDSHYIVISINGLRYAAHRLAYLYVYGYMPKKVDHIDNDAPKTDNRICNLRDSTNSQNLCNRGKNKNNTSGYKCVSWSKSVNKWVASIKINGKQLHLGCFDTPEEAHLAYCKAAPTYHGEFARIK